MPKIIVCVDDDPFYKDLFRAILEPKGYQVISAMNPSEGWEALKKVKPDLMTLDVMMPEKEGFFDGYGLLKRIKDDEQLKGLKVMMISALGDPEDVQHGIECGAAAYLPKQEMTPDRLLLEVDKLIGK